MSDGCMFQKMNVVFKKMNYTGRSTFMVHYLNIMFKRLIKSFSAKLLKGCIRLIIFLGSLQIVLVFFCLIYCSVVMAKTHRAPCREVLTGRTESDRAAQESRILRTPIPMVRKRAILGNIFFWQEDW
jgi:hypothetical protein